MSAIALSQSSPALVGFTGGVLLHYSVLRNGEWNLYGPTFCGVAIATWWFIFLASVVTDLSRSTLISSSLEATVVTWSAIIGIAASMSMYRLFFHRLRHFPGPMGAKLSSWWASSLHGKGWHFYEGVKALHAQYGDYVRIAPDALSITDPAVVAAVHGPDSRCTKGSFYSLAEPQRNLLMIRNKVEHARKRRDWDRAFNIKSLNAYEPTLWSYTQELMSQISRNLNKPMNIAKWLQFYAFDTMADLAFGKDFNSLKTGTPSRMMEEIEGPVKVFGLFHFVPWVPHFFKIIPFMVRHKAHFDTYLSSLVAERKAMGDSKRDIFSWFLDAYNALPTKTSQDEKNLIGDAMLIVIAGSGPTAPAIAAALFHLAQRPDLTEQIYAETKAIGFRAGSTGFSELANMKFLDAVITESLRLHPPIRSGPERMTPPEGLQINDTYIPGDIRLQTPLYPLHRDPRSFAEPDSFIPTRWTTQPELIHDRSVYIPFFGSGTFSCVGRALALMQMRQVLASIVSAYTFELASETLEKGEEEFEKGTTDYFACFANELGLVFRERT